MRVRMRVSCTSVIMLNSSTMNTSVSRSACTLGLVSDPAPIHVAMALLPAGRPNAAWLVLAKSGLRRTAAAPVLAVSMTVLPCCLSWRVSFLVVNVLPLPGPPVSTTRPLLCSRMASTVACCASVYGEPSRSLNSATMAALIAAASRRRVALARWRPPGPPPPAAPAAAGGGSRRPPYSTVKVAASGSSSLPSSTSSDGTYLPTRVASKACRRWLLYRW